MKSHFKNIGLVFCFFLVVSTSAQAFTLRLSQQDLNQVIGMAFPQTQYYQGSQVIFSNPYVTLAANNVIAINVDIKGNEGQAMLSASAELSGKVHYNGSSGELQIVRPQLDNFTVHDSNQIEEEKITEWVAQLKGQSAPVILLLDFKQLDLSFIGNRVPSRMWVEKGQLVVEY